MPIFGGGLKQIGRKCRRETKQYQFWNSYVLRSGARGSRKLNVLQLTAALITEGSPEENGGRPTFPTSDPTAVR
jgi:hypothetical protein